MPNGEHTQTGTSNPIKHSLQQLMLEQLEIQKNNHFPSGTVRRRRQQLLAQIWKKARGKPREEKPPNALTSKMLHKHMKNEERKTFDKEKRNSGKKLIRKMNAEAQEILRSINAKKVMVDKWMDDISAVQDKEDQD